MSGEVPRILQITLKYFSNSELTDWHKGRVEQQIAPQSSFLVSYIKWDDLPLSELLVPFRSGIFIVRESGNISQWRIFQGRAGIPCLSQSRLHFFSE